MTETCDLQDHILPYILGERHVEDTLFIVVEEDFRFFDEGQGEPIAPEPKLKASQAVLQSALEPAVAARLQVGVPGYHTKSAASSNSGPLDEAYPQHPQKQCHQRPPHGGPGLSNQEWPLWRHTTFRGSCGAG